MRQTLILLPLSLWVTSTYAFYPFVPEYLLQEGHGGARLRADREETDPSSKEARRDGPIAFPLSRKATADVGQPYTDPFRRHADIRILI